MRHRKSLFLFIEAVALGGPTSLCLFADFLILSGDPFINWKKADR